MQEHKVLEQEGPLRRLPRKPRRALPVYTDVLIPGLAAASGAMLGFGLPNLIGADGFVDSLKCALIALTASGVSYGINRLAIERGARQAAIGTPGAKLLSTVSIVAVGAGLFSATFSGFTIAEVDRLHLEEFGRRQAAFVEEQQSAAMQAARVLPAVRGIVADLKAKEDCERLASCISGSGSGGVGPVSRALSSERQRAEAILASLDWGADNRVLAFKEINGLQSRFHSTLADDGLSAEDRRAEASDLAMHISQAANTLAETDPLAPGLGYADELSGSTGANDKLAPLLRGYADQLRAVAASAKAAPAGAPSIPPKAGVSDTLAQVAHFLPIAMIVAVVELIFPLTLWLFTYFAFLGRLAQEEAAEEIPSLVRRNGHDRPRASR